MPHLPGANELMVMQGDILHDRLWCFWTWLCKDHIVDTMAVTGIILWMRPATERRCYIVTSLSLSGCIHRIIPAVNGSLGKSVWLWMPSLHGLPTGLLQVLENNCSPFIKSLLFWKSWKFPLGVLMADWRKEVFISIHQSYQIQLWASGLRLLMKTLVS